MSVRVADIPVVSSLSSPAGTPLSAALLVMVVSILSVWAVHCTSEASGVHESAPEASPVQCLQRWRLLLQNLQRSRCPLQNHQWWRLLLQNLPRWWPFMNSLTGLSWPWRPFMNSLSAMSLLRGLFKNTLPALSQ